MRSFHQTSWLVAALCAVAACALEAPSPTELRVHEASQTLGLAPTITLAPQPSSMRLNITTEPALASLYLNRMDRTEGYYKRYTTLAVNARGSYVHDDTTVIPGREYCYVAVATEVGQPSGVASAPACGVFGTSPPAAPTGFALQRASERSLELSFTDASSDETSFEVEQQSVSGGWLPVYSLAASAGTGTARSFTVYELDSELTYCFRARAVNGTGSSVGPVACGRTLAALSWDPVVSATTTDIITILHPAPGQLTVRWLDGGTASSWSVNTFDGLGSLLGTATVSDHRVPQPQAQAVTLSGLTAGRLYCFSVARPGAASRKVCEAPRATRTSDSQREPAAAATSQLMTVSPVSNTSLQLTIVNPQPGQMIERIRATTGARETWQQDATARASLTDTGLSAGQTYCYRLWVFNAYGSRYSDLACATTTASAPATPRNLRVTNQADRDVTIAWDSVPNASEYLVTYNGTRPAYVDHDGSRTTSATSTTITGFDQFTYCFRVRARNAFGTSGQAEVCDVRIDGSGMVSYGTLLRQVATGQTTFSHRVDPGVGPTARLAFVTVAGNAFTPYEVQFIRPGQACESNPSGGVLIEPGQTLMGSGLMTLFGSSEPVLPATLFACKRPRNGAGYTTDPMPIQVVYRR